MVRLLLQSKIVNFWIKFLLKYKNSAEKMSHLDVNAIYALFVVSIITFTILVLVLLLSVFNHLNLQKFLVIMN